MNSDYGNYSKELGKAREEFSSTTRKLKENYDKSVHDLEASNALREEQTKKVNDERRDKLIEGSQEQLNTISNKTNQTLERRQQEYIDSLRDERDNFNFEKKAQKENFQNNLNSVKDSYARSFDQLKNTHERQQKEAESNFVNSLQTNKYNTDKKIQEISKGTDRTIADYNHDAVQQKKELTRKYQQNLTDQYKESHDALDKKTEAQNKKYNDLAKSKDNEVKNLNERFDFQINKTKNDDKELFDTIKDRYEDHTKDLLRSFQNKMNHAEDAANQKLQREKNEHDKELYLAEREKDLYIDRNFKGEGAEGQKNLMRDHYERRLENLRKQMADQTIKFQRDATELDQGVQGELKNRALDNRKVNDKRNDDFHKELSSIERKTKEKDDNMISTFRSKLNELEEGEIKKVGYERELGTKKIDNQRKDFAKTVNRLAEINTKNIEKLQDENAKDKVNILESAKRELHESVTDVKENYRQKFEKTIDSYGKRLELEKNIAERSKQQSEDRVETIQKNAEEKVHAETLFNHESRLADRKDMQEKVSDLKRDYDQKFRVLKSDFDHELGHVKKENSILLQRLAKKNETDKTLLMSENAKEIKRVTTQMHEDLVRANKAAKLEKDTLIDHYEKRIQELKANYDLDKLKVSEDKKDENIG